MKKKKDVPPWIYTLTFAMKEVCLINELSYDSLDALFDDLKKIMNDVLCECRVIIHQRKRPDV